MSQSRDDNRAGASEPLSNVVRFPRSKRLLAPPELAMSKPEKALQIRRRILNDDLPEHLLDEMLRLLDERESG
jgi:hypothetical protein